MQMTLHTVVLGFDQALNSDVTGAITSVFGSAPTGVNTWASWIAAYDEFRVLAFDVKYMPNDRYNRGVSIYTSAGYVVADNTDNTPLSAVTKGPDYESCKLVSLDSPFSMTARMNEQGSDSTYQKSNGVNSYFWIKYFFSGLTASTNYGRCLSTYRVQFRGPGTG